MVEIKLSNYDYLINFIPGSKKVLDFGCGRGDLLVRLLRKGHNAKGCDISDLIYEKSEWILKPLVVNKHIFRVSSNKLPFKNSEFDYILSNQVFEHVSDPKTSLKEIHRTLKVNGILILCFPTEEVFIEPHLKLPLIHRLKKYPSFLKSYLKLAYYFRIGQAKKTDLSIEKWVQNRLEYLHKNINYTRRKKFIKMLNELNFNVDDLTQKLIKDRYNFNFYEKILCSIFKPHQVSSCLFISKKIK